LTRDTSGRPAGCQHADCPQDGHDSAKTGGDGEERPDAGHEGQPDREANEKECEESSDVL
jgi:hypothetical protein